MDPFVHLHVASGYSLQHGASHPHVLVERAADHGMDTLALTDRDGVYGAVKFATACQKAGVRPVFGVDLALRPTAPVPVERGPARRRTPARGGAFLETAETVLPRVVLLARDGRGWAALCRLVSATHLTGEPRSPRRWVAETSRHNAAHPALSWASRVTRGCRGSTDAPPLAGWARPGWGRPAPRIEGWTIGGPASSPLGSTARSTPSTGRMPADCAARANFTAP